MVAFSLALAFVLALDITPFLRGGEILHWQWAYEPAFERALPLIVAVTLYIGAAWLLIRRERVKTLLLTGVVATAVISLAVAALRANDVAYELFVRTISPGTTGQHSAAAEIDWSTYPLNDWPVFMESLVGYNIHVALSPPGLVVAHGALNAAFDSLPAIADPLYRAVLPYQCHNYTLLDYTPGEWASAWFGILMPLWAGLAVFPLYAVARRLVGERALLVVAWWPLIPALTMFTPTWNVVYPLLALLAFWLLLRGMERGAPWLVGSGVVSGLLTFSNFALVPLVGLFGFYTLLHYILDVHLTGMARHAPTKPVTNPEDSGLDANDYKPRFNLAGWTRPVIVGLWFGVGLFAPWVIYWLATGLTPLDLLGESFDTHFLLDRPYIPWLWMHFWEWALFTGIPFIALWLTAAVRRRNTLAIALLCTVVVLLVSNTARGETGRVWLFLAPFVLIAAAQSLSLNSREDTPQAKAVRLRSKDYKRAKGAVFSLFSRIGFFGSRTTISAAATSNDQIFKSDQQSRAWLAIAVAQAVLLVALAAAWLVINTPGIHPAPETPPALTDARPIDVRFGNEFRLVGWDAEATDGVITLHLNWQSETQITTPYWFAALLVDPDGAQAGEPVVWQPFDTLYPATCWQPGVVVGDSVELPLPQDAQPGDWWVSLVAFADVDNPLQTLPVTLPDGTQDVQVGLGPVTVP